MSNKLFPVCVIDDFYDNPYDVREFALSQKFYPNDDNRWPGSRTKGIHEIDDYLFHHFCEKVLSIFYSLENIKHYKIYTAFQKIKPFHPQKDNPNNRGFIHRDGSLFGGVIYLNLNSEERTGTSIYTFKNKWYCDNYLDNYANNIKFKKYGGENLTDDDILKWDNSRDQYIETVRVENVFNRCILFDGNNFHGVPYFGIEERLTQVFFLESLSLHGEDERGIRFPLFKTGIGS